MSSSHATGDAREASLIRMAPWPIMVSLVVLPFFKYGLALGASSLLVSAVGSAVAYGLGIYLYYAVARRALLGKSFPLWAATGLSLIIGLWLAAETAPWIVLIDLVLPLAAGLLVARRAVVETDQFRLYLSGGAVVLVGGLIMLAPQWPEMMRVAAAVAEIELAEWPTRLISLGYSTSVAQEMTEQFARMFDAVVRLLPWATLMSLLMQFSIGLLWFLYAADTDRVAFGRLVPFKRWKAPFALAPVIIPILLARILGSGSVTLVADNLLAGLTMVYGVTGLALLGYFFEKTKMPLIVRIVFYIMLTLTGLIGYVGLVLLGFIDSFADWRRLSGPDEEALRTK